MKTTKKPKFKFIRNVILICLAYFVCSSFFGVFSQINDYNNKIDELNNQIKEETEVSQQLEEQKNNMHSDENYKDIARSVLGLVEPGDKVYITKDN